MVESIEITQEERERIIKGIKNIPDVNFGICGLADIFFGSANCRNDNCSNCITNAKEKLLALIESAPAKKNMRASEFADKFEKEANYLGSIYGAIAECLGYDGSKTSGREDVKRLCDAIRNLDAPEDGMQWPLDKDGVPIKPDDTVYIGESEYTVLCIVYGTKDVMVRLFESNNLLLRSPKDLTHKKPRTLDDIIREMRNAFCDGEFRIDLINEVYAMGRAAGNEKASEV